MLTKLIKFCRRHYLDYLAIFIILTIYYSWLQWNNYIGDPDGFYHAKIVEFLRQGHLLTSLPWMQFSTLKDNFTDHQLLYHLLLIPFSYFKTTLIGIKIATVVFASLMGTFFYWLLKKLNILYPAWLTLLLITLNGLSFRLSLIKTNSLSLILIWLLIYALFYKKLWLTLIVGWVFVWLYGGWPLALIILFAYWLADIIYNKIKPKKIFSWLTKKNHNLNLKLLISLIAGLISGLIINPYWPKNLYFYYQQIVQIGIVNLGSKFGVGGEWYGASFLQIVSTAPHLFIGACLIFILLFFNQQLITKKTLFGFILTFGFLLLTVKSSRYIEYFLPFALLFTASGLTDLKKILTWSKMKKYWQYLNVYLKIFLTVTLIIFAVVIVPLVFKNTFKVATPTRFPIDKFAPATNWLKNNIPSQSIILHSDWDEWPMLFYYNDQNYYIVGLDPTFMYNFNANLNQLYIDLTTGEIKNNVATQIKNSFGAEFVLIEKADEEFLNNLEADPLAKLVYQDAEVNIYQIN